MIYLDNAATTLKKPEAVYKKFMSTWRSCGANAGRGGHRLALAASMKVYEAASTVAQLFKIDNPENIAFSYNTTMALNMAIKGVVGEEDHVVITSLEHNSVYRPVAASGCMYTIVSCDENYDITAKAIEGAIRPNTKLIAVNHASNVCKTVCDIEKIGRIAKKHGCLFLVDSAQSGGVLDIDVEMMNIDLLAFAGHKALFGPQGTGGLYVKENVKLKTIIEGGSGANSLDVSQPAQMPEHLSAGTVNTPGIAALGEGVKFVLKEGTKAIFAHENMLANRFCAAAGNMNNVKVYTENQQGCGVVSININGLDPVSAAEILDKRYYIAVRSGYHCSPLCHRMLNTVDMGGTIRFSFGYFNTKAETDRAIDAVYKISKSVN